MMTYTDAEYQLHLSGDGWSRGETDHLMNLAKRFDLRFVVMQDRWNRDKFQERTVEDIKERYYNIANTLLKVLQFYYFIPARSCYIILSVLVAALMLLLILSRMMIGVYLLYRSIGFITSVINDISDASRFRIYVPEDDLLVSENQAHM